MQNIEYLSRWYAPGSHRAICTPSGFARSHLFYAQEIGHFKRLSGGHERQRSKLDSYLFVVVCSGRGQLTYDGRHWPLAAGDCFWLDCRRAHSYQSSAEQPWELKWLHFNGTHAPAYYQLFCEQHDTVLHPADPQALTALLDLLFIDGDAPAGQSELLQAAHITQLLTASITAAAPTRPNTQMEAVQRYLQQSFAQTHSLDELAARFFISKYALARQFKASYDCTIFEYLIRLRITRAKQLLRDTDQSMAEIAAACGYSGQNFFSRQFLKVEGLTPAAYRRAWK